MVRLKKVSRRSFFKGWTPGLVLGVFLWFCCVAFTFYEGRRTGTNLALCPLLQITATPCPLCGGSTATYRLLSGNFTGAFFANPLVSLTVPLIALWLFFRLGLGIRPSIQPKALWLLPVALLALSSWTYVIDSRKSSFKPFWSQPAASPALCPDAEKPATSSMKRADQKKDQKPDPTD